MDRYPLAKKNVGDRSDTFGVYDLTEEQLDSVI
jgi:hypothetical protein